MELVRGLADPRGCSCKRCMAPPRREGNRLYHRSLIDVDGDGDAVIVRVGGELFHVINVGAADVGVEEDRVSVAVLTPYGTPESL
jgi:hypothetical protein